MPILRFWCLIPLFCLCMPVSARANTQDDRPLISIVIDDMGVDRKRSARAVESLPAEMTFAYLPYATHVRAQVAQARADGHEIIVHMPMEPVRDTIDPGPDYLDTDFDNDELYRRIEANLSAFDGYIGVNNHMGSKFTAYPRGMEMVMQAVAARDVLFLDSRTTPDSVGVTSARDYNIPATSRDVFLDDTDSRDFLDAALAKTERMARKNGSAIAIGHPRDITLEALADWLPTVEEKGFRLAPLSAVVKLRQKNNIAETAQQADDGIAAYVGAEQKPWALMGDTCEMRPAAARRL